MSINLPDCQESPALHFQMAHRFVAEVVQLQLLRECKCIPSKAAACASQVICILQKAIELAAQATRRQEICRHNI